MRAQTFFAFRLSVILLFSCGVAFGQLANGGAPGVSTAMLKLFGNNPAFTAHADVQVIDQSKTERLRTPMQFALLDGNVRVEIDLAQAHSADLPPAALAGIKQLGLDRVISIVRRDKKTMCLVYPNARSFVLTPLSKEETETAPEKLALAKTPLGRETLDGHACAKNQVAVSNGTKTVLNATTWNAVDLRDFPIQIATRENNLTSVMHFQQIQFVRSDARQFEPPAGYAHYGSQDALLLAQSAKVANAGKKPAK